MTRALVTGASGFAGGHLIAYLQAATDWEVWSLGRSALPGVNSALADLLDREAVASEVARVRPDLVFHLAAQSFVPASFEDPAGTFTANVLGQLHLFQAIAAAGLDPRVLVVSSNEVYGMVRPDEVPVSEDTLLRPTNPYAVSKAAQDLMAGQWFYTNRLQVVRVRPFNHIGPGQRPMFVAPAFARQIARIERGLQEPVIRVGNLDARRDFSDVRDMVRAYHLAIIHGEAGAIYNAGSGESISIQHLLDLLLGMSQATISIERDPARMRPADVPQVACDATRLRERTGWTPAYTLEQTLRDILAEWRERAARGE